jgi:hypothetical protein
MYPLPVFVVVAISVVETRSAPRPTSTQGVFDLLGFSACSRKSVSCYTPKYHGLSETFQENVPQTCKDMAILCDQDVISASTPLSNGIASFLPPHERHVDGPVNGTRLPRLTLFSPGDESNSRSLQTAHEAVNTSIPSILALPLPPQAPRLQLAYSPTMLCQAEPVV